MAVIGFAHRGGQWPDARANTLRAFRRSLEAGATALESDVRLTADGVPVLLHDATYGLFHRQVATVPADRLPDRIPRLEQLYAECGTAFDLSLDIKDAKAAAATVAVAQAAGAAGRLWMCGNLDQLPGWRKLSPDVHLVDSTSLRYVGEGVPAHVERMRAAGVEALNLRAPEWNAGVVAAVHAGGRLAFGWDAQTVETLQALRAMGIDGVYCDHVHRMVTTLGS